MEGRHVGLDFYDLLIEGDYTHNLVHAVQPRSYRRLSYTARSETLIDHQNQRGRVPAVRTSQISDRSRRAH
jgi:hypothetical protein